MEQQASDLLMWVGAKYYAMPEDFASECIHQGLSKRIARTNVPEEGIVNGVSRLFLIHPWACLTVDEEAGHTLEELRDRLASLGSTLVDEWLQDWDRNPAWIVRQILAEPREDMTEAIAIFKDCRVLLTPGVFGFSYITGIQYVAKKGEPDVPDELKGKGIEAVQVVYDEAKDKGGHDGTVSTGGNR